jgi:GTP-binding protein
MFVIVDARRGLTEGDEALIEWAQDGHRLHVLLSKADKLNRGEAAAVLHATSTRLAGLGTVQLFSALRGIGLREAQETLAAWLGLGPRSSERRK